MGNIWVNNYSIKRKIADVSSVDMQAWARISDYVGNTWFVIQHGDIYISKWLQTVEYIHRLKDEFNTITTKILSMDSVEVAQILQQNLPKNEWTDSNIESFRQIFIS